MNQILKDIAVNSILDLIDTVRSFFSGLSSESKDRDILLNSPIVKKYHLHKPIIEICDFLDDLDTKVIDKFRENENGLLEAFYFYRLLAPKINILLEWGLDHNFLYSFLCQGDHCYAHDDVKTQHYLLGQLDNVNGFLMQIEGQVFQDGVFQLIYNLERVESISSTVDIGDFDSYYEPQCRYMNKNHLPSVPAVYFVHNHYNLLYIGQTTNLRNRFVQHHRQPDFDYLEKMRIPLHIDYISCKGKEELLLDEERYWITHLKPPLNNSSVIQLVA